MNRPPRPPAEAADGVVTQSGMKTELGHFSEMRAAACQDEPVLEETYAHMA